MDGITIRPTVNESSATVEYLDSSDTEIADADSGKTGQQVSLSVGANTIKVKVTAEDTTTTNPYTVVVTRAAAAPGAPTGLAATANGQSQIDLAWTAPGDTGGSAITGYKIEVSPDGSSWSDLVADTQSTATTYPHMGLNAATTRHYRVSAINAVGTSDPSGSDDATTEASTVVGTTVTQSGDGATWSLVGENTVAAGQQTYTYTLTRTSGSLPLNEYFGFTSDTLEAERFQDGYSDCTGTNYFCFTLSNSYSYSEYTVSNVRFAGRILTDTSPHVLTLKVATRTPAGTTVTLGVVRRSGVPRSGGLLITVGTATTNTAPTAANNTVTTAEDRAYTFTAADFGFMDADTGAALASVKIVTVPAAGILALDGTAVTTDGVVTKAQIDGDMLTFRPARDAHGDPYTTFTFTVNDGTDDSASAYTMTIDVTDAPAPVCTVPSFGDRREIWSGTVTVERIESAGLVFYGFDEVLSGGTLLPSQSFFHRFEQLRDRLDRGCALREPALFP